MRELDDLEQAMREWKPRKPTTRLARRLFGRRELPPATLRRAEFWSWLAPVATCALTVLVVVGSANHREAVLEGSAEPGLSQGFSTELGWSNMPQAMRLSRMDANVQWNVCPELALPARTEEEGTPAMAGANGEAATNLNQN